MLEEEVAVKAKEDIVEPEFIVSTSDIILNMSYKSYFLNIFLST